MSAAQVAEWEAFAELEPWGGRRDDLRAGNVVAAVFNANPFRPPSAKAVKPSDIYPDTLAVPRPLPKGPEVAEKAHAFFLSLGGKA